MRLLHRIAVAAAFTNSAQPRIGFQVRSVHSIEVSALIVYVHLLGDCAYKKPADVVDQLDGNIAGETQQPKMAAPHAMENLLSDL
jgi:hypothetical protein